MKTETLLLLGLGLIAISKGEASSSPLAPTTQQSNAAALASPAAQQAYQNIAGTYGTNFAHQVEVAVNTASNAAEAFAMLGYNGANTYNPATPSAPVVPPSPPPAAPTLTTLSYEESRNLGARIQSDYATITRAQGLYDKNPSYYVDAKDTVDRLKKEIQGFYDQYGADAITQALKDAPKNY